jgi:hypothetical protein
MMALIAIIVGAPRFGDAWAAVAVFSMLAGSVAFLGFPKRDQLLFLAREGA